LTNRNYNATIPVNNIRNDRIKNDDHNSESSDSQYCNTIHCASQLMLWAKKTNNVLQCINFISPLDSLACPSFSQRRWSLPSKRPFSKNIWIWSRLTFYYIANLILLSCVCVFFVFSYELLCFNSANNCYTMKGILVVHSQKLPDKKNTVYICRIKDTTVQSVSIISGLKDSQFSNLITVWRHLRTKLLYFISYLHIF